MAMSCFVFVLLGRVEYWKINRSILWQEDRFVTYDDDDDDNITCIPYKLQLGYVA